MNWLAMKLIQAYQLLLSPLFGGHCRFVPSCSEYAQQMLEQKNFFSAFVLIGKRLLSCHPWGKHEN